MSRRRKRLIYFVCSTIKENNLLSELVVADSLGLATDLFFSKFGCKPKVVHGPFYKKTIEQIVINTPFKVTNQVKKAHYGDWLVNAIILKEPADSALLIFLHRTDGKKTLVPKGTNIVLIKDLRFIDE